jgi:hypothetical protein
MQFTLDDTLLYLSATVVRLPACTIVGGTKIKIYLFPTIYPKQVFKGYITEKNIFISGPNPYFEFWESCLYHKYFHYIFSICKLTEYLSHLKTIVLFEALK